MSSSNDTPHFRFYPGSYGENGPFEESESPCDVCRLPCVWRYTGNIYVVGEKPSVCARCMSNGRLDAFFGDRRFSFHDTELEGVSPELASEVLEGTPGVACFNPFEWPVLNGIPLAFVGYGDSDDLWADPEAVSAMRAAWSEIFQEQLDGKTSYLLVFNEIEGPRFVAVIDLD